MTKQGIYLDHAASTPLLPAVRKIIETAMDFFANPSGLHEEGIFCRQKIEAARQKVATVISAHSSEVIFTGSGTESNNLALRGLCQKDSHIVTTNIEHPSVIETCRALAKEGVTTTFVPVEKNGIVDPKKIKEAIRPNTALVSVISASNEIGTIQPIAEIAKVIRHFRKEGETQTPYFHTDAVQAFNYLPVGVEKLGVDLLTLNGSKIYGPRGSGVLYKKKAIPLAPIMFGGEQERGLRPGTENLPAILGLAEAISLANLNREKESKRLRKLQNYFLEELEKSGLPFVLNGDRAARLPNNVNISLDRLTGDIWVIELSARGIAVSSKSACKEGSAAESYVVAAIGGRGANSIRFSFGLGTTQKELAEALTALKDIFAKYAKI